MCKTCLLSIFSTLLILFVSLILLAFIVVMVWEGYLPESSFDLQSNIVFLKLMFHVSNLKSSSVLHRSTAVNMLMNHQKRIGYSVETISDTNIYFGKRSHNIVLYLSIPTPQWPYSRFRSVVCAMMLIVPKGHIIFTFAGTVPILFPLTGEHRHCTHKFPVYSSAAFFVVKFKSD